MLAVEWPSEWLFWTAIVGLGGWRLASLLVNEDGPFEVFARIRAWSAPPPGREYGFLGKVLLCVWCTSIYTTSAVAALWFVHPAIVAVIAAWAVAIITERIATR